MTTFHEDHGAGAAERAAPSRMGRRALLAAGIPAAVAASMLGQSPAGAETTVGGAEWPHGSLADLRALADSSGIDAYFVDDPGQAGLFVHDRQDASSADNTGVIVVAGDGARFKRVGADPGGLWGANSWYNVRWFGAVGDGVADDAAAIQLAVDSAVQAGRHGDVQPPVYLPAGQYAISSMIVCDASKPGQRADIRGDGWSSRIFPHSSITATDPLVALIGFTDEEFANRSNFENFHMRGLGRCEYGIRAPKSVRGQFEKLTAYSFTEAGLGVGSWLNRVVDCKLSHNSGDGFRSIAKSFNSASITRCMIVQNRIGINIALTGGGVWVQGCNLESNSVCAINVEGNMTAVDIHDNYFEAAPTAGRTFAEPARTVHAFIVANGNDYVHEKNPPSSVVGSLYAPGPIRVSGNLFAVHSLENPVIAAVWAATGAFTFTNNAVRRQGANNMRTLTILQTGTSASSSRGGSIVENITIEGTGHPSENLIIENIQIDDLAGGASLAHQASIQGVVKANYAPSLVRFQPARSTRGTWRASSTSYRQYEVRELGDDGEWGFTLDLDQHPELAGRYVYLACWVKPSDDQTKAVLTTSQLGPMTDASGVQGWHVVSYCDLMPDSGTVTFGVSKSGGGALSVAHPVLSEVGARYDEYDQGD